MSNSTYEGWVVVFESGTDYEADLVRGRLDDAGIPAIVFTQRDHAFNVNFGDLAQVHVLVQPEHVEAANQLLPAAVLSDERERDWKYDWIINACVIGGLVLQILGGALLSTRAILLGAVLLIIGLSLVAKRKGRDWKWGFMGLLSLGLLWGSPPWVWGAAPWGWGSPPWGLIIGILFIVFLSSSGLLVVAALKDRQPEENPTDTWKCRKCGEDIEDSFGTCWKCGTDRDDYNGSMKEDEQKGV